MRVALINGSPKGARSASQTILSFAKSVLPNSAEFIPITLKEPQIDQVILKQIISCNKLIWAFPLYVDGVPSHLLPWFFELEQIYRSREGAKPQVYALVNCGFYEADQNEVMLEIIRNWCLKSGLSWGQGVGIGAGGVFSGLGHIPLGRWPFQKLATTFQEFASNFGSNEAGADLYVSPDFPRFSYKLVAEFSWRRSIVRNGLKLRDIHKKIELETS